MAPATGLPVSISATVPLIFVGVGAWVTVTFSSLHAPVAVTLIVPVRDSGLVLASNEHMIVPALVPLTPDVIRSQLLPEFTDAVQGVDPLPVIEALNVVVPASFATSELKGDTDRLGFEHPY